MKNLHKHMESSDTRSVLDMVNPMIEELMAA
jgi:hypothetical protein